MTPRALHQVAVRIARRTFPWFVGASLLGGCATTRDLSPEARVPDSGRAQVAFARIEEAWDHVTEGEGASLESLLRTYLTTYATDAAVPLVRAYLAIVVLRTGHNEQALQLVEQNFGEPEGTTRDLMNVVRAHVYRTRKRPDLALDLLRPLAGKLVDPIGRDLLLEEIALAAVEAHIDFEAIAYMNAWLDGVASQDRDRIKNRVTELLRQIPSNELEDAYRPMRAKGRASGYSQDMRRVVATVLAEGAVARGDSELARWLLDSSLGGAPPTTEASVELRDLAASTKGLRTVTGRTVGLLLPAGSLALRDEAAEVSRGVSWALGLPLHERAEGEVRLVTRDGGEDAVSTERALEELAGEGAAVIIAGFDTQTAARALAWGDAVGISVLALVPPPKGARPRHGYVVGEPEAEQIDLLSRALVAHGKKTAYGFVRDADSKVVATSGLPLTTIIPCTLPASNAGVSRFPVTQALRARAGLLVAGSFECLRDLVLDIGRYEAPLFATTYLAATLEAGLPLPDPRTRNARYLLVSAGHLPFLSALPESMPDADIRGYLAAFGAPPTYWSALGRDAGVFARAAVAPLPPDAATEDAAIFQRRAIVDAGLMAGRMPLWSTEQTGFDQDRTLNRALHIVEATGGQKGLSAPVRGKASLLK